MRLFWDLESHLYRAVGAREAGVGDDIHAVRIGGKHVRRERLGVTLEDIVGTVSARQLDPVAAAVGREHPRAAETGGLGRHLTDHAEADHRDGFTGLDPGHARGRMPESPRSRGCAGGYEIGLQSRSPGARQCTYDTVSTLGRTWAALTASELARRAARPFDPARTSAFTRLRKRRP